MVAESRECARLKARLADEFALMGAHVEKHDELFREIMAAIARARTAGTVPAHDPSMQTVVREVRSVLNELINCCNRSSGLISELRHTYGYHSPDEQQVALNKQTASEPLGLLAHLP
jgi:predicted secreted Zn-dependent protease